MASDAISATSGQIDLPKAHGFTADFFIRLFRTKPLGAVGGIIFMILLFTGIFANFLAPFGENEIDPINRLKNPSRGHILGTDQLGRDMLSRIIYGARLSLIIGSSATFFSIIISTFLGITTGFIGGKYDMFVQRLVDAWMIFPGLVMLIVFVSILGPGMQTIIFVLGLQYGIAGSRIIRGSAISIKENMYVKAADSIGASTTRMLLRHILPNIMAPIIVLFTTRIAAVILSEASLSFLGLGIPAPAPSWGGMLSSAGRGYMLRAPFMAFVPGVALTVVVYGINVFGDAMRDLLDPRLRGGLGSFSGKKIKDKKQGKEPDKES
jgi:peptide/nickel transport system permease protein